jgi:hypothetical protein
MLNPRSTEVSICVPCTRNTLRRDLERSPSLALKSLRRSTFKPVSDGTPNTGQISERNCNIVVQFPLQKPYLYSLLMSRHFQLFPIIAQLITHVSGAVALNKENEMTMLLLSKVKVKFSPSLPKHHTMNTALA